mgnify:CR=1 FL=1
MAASYDTFAPFYDLEYGHKENDLDFYLDMAETYGVPVLEIGVGTGRVALELATHRFHVWGIDNSPNMLREAQHKIDDLHPMEHSRLTMTHADMRDFSLPQQFPLCIIPFRAFLHNLTQMDQLSTLRQIRAHLTENGILALDVFVPLYHLMAQTEWHDVVESHELADETTPITINIDIQHHPAEQRLHITNTYLDANEPHETQASMTYRYIFRYEMEALLRCAGFQVLQVYGGFEKQPYDYQSGIMVFVARVKN